MAARIRLVRGPALRRRRAGRAGAHRGRDPAQRPARRGHRRNLGRGHPALRRAAARGPGPDGGDHQLLQPPQHHLPGAGRNELGLTRTCDLPRDSSARRC